jgi:hypothetical protein
MNEKYLLIILKFQIITNYEIFYKIKQYPP